MRIDLKNQEKVKVDNLRGGKGSVYMQKLSPLLEHMKGYNIITIPSRSSIGIHTHEEDEEVIFVLEGTGTLVIDGVNHPFTQGLVSVCKRGRNHSVINTSSEDLVLLAVINEI